MEKIYINILLGESMQTNKTNNIIFLRNIESNFIEEAIVILKDGIEINNEESEKKEDMNKKINILKEAEFIINHKINQENYKYEKNKSNKLEKKIKKLKIINIITIIICMLAIIVR